MGEKKIAIPPQVKSKVIVKKTKPYPIHAEIVHPNGNPPLVGQILKLTKVGLQMEVAQYLFKVGEEVKIKFKLPTNEQTIEESMRAIKTTDRFKDSLAQVKHYLVEFHFKNLDKLNAKHIAQFVFAIGQKPENTTPS